MPGEILEPDVPASREMRRSYHDSIAELRALSQTVLQCAAEGSHSVTEALAGGPAPSLVDAGMEQTAARVDAEVLDLLALQGPVGRDLRLILSARDVASIGLLCVGLCRAVSGRVPSARSVLTPDLSAGIAGVGEATTSLLRSAARSWAGLDEGLASQVAERAAEVRLCHIAFLADLVALREVPIGAALDLGITARAYERLTDHAEEVAGKVLFTVNGPDGLAGTNPAP